MATGSLHRAIRAALPARSRPLHPHSSPTGSPATMEGVAEHLRRNLAALQANLQRSVQDVASQAAALCQGAHMRQQPSGLAPLFAVRRGGRHHLGCEPMQDCWRPPGLSPRRPGPRSAAAAACRCHHHAVGERTHGWSRCGRAPPRPAPAGAGVQPRGDQGAAGRGARLGGGQQQERVCAGGGRGATMRHWNVHLPGAFLPKCMCSCNSVIFWLLLALAAL